MTLALPSRPVLADLVPASRVADAVLVLGGTALVAGLSQVLLPLPFTPVPLSLGTLGVLLVGATLGPVRGGASLALYLIAGVAGVGWFAGGGSGWHFASFGYVVGYLLAAVVVGRLARAGADRRVASTIAAMLAGSAIIYACGVPWLMAFLGADLSTALMLGVVPFLIGDAIKSVIAAVVLPGAWRLVGRTER